MAQNKTGSVSEAEFDNEARNVFAKGMNEMVAADKRGDKPLKLFGFLEVPAGAAIFAKIGYNALSKFGADRLQQPIYEITHQLVGERLSHLMGKTISEGTAAKSAAAATFAASFAMKAGGYVVPIFTTFYDQHAEQAKTARVISPVLDEIKGNHSALSFMMVGMSDNTVIATHKHRLKKLYGSKRMEHITDMVFNAGANILLDVGQGRAMWKHGMSPDAIAAGMHVPKLAADVAIDPREASLAAAKAARKEKSGDTLEYLWTTGGAGLSQIFASAAQRKQKEIEATPSALEMIVDLEQQISHNPNVQVRVKGEQRDCTLETYIMKVMVNHQRELADIDPNYSELRPALQEELKEVVQPIADSIRHGEVNALSLIRFFGEPKKYPVILNNGRALATADEVSDMLAKEAGHKGAIRLMNVDEFLARQELKIANLKQAFKELEGDSRIKLMALFPDTVLEKASVNAKEIKQVQTFRASNDYDHFLESLANGLAQEQERDLKHAGMTSRQIERVEHATESVGSDKQAMNKVKSSSANPNGIENDLIDWVMPKLTVGDVQYIEKVVDRGEQLIGKKTVDRGKHRDEQHASAHQHGAKDSEYSHTDREHSRREGKHQAHTAID